MLTQSGIADEIQTVRDAHEALDLITGNHLSQTFVPDFILVDINMPMMNGFDFIAAFQKINLPETQRPDIIIVSSSSDDSDILRAKQLGVTQYLTKPLIIEQLRSALEDLKNH